MIDVILDYINKHMKYLPIDSAWFILENEELIARCLDRAEILLNSFDITECCYCDDYWRCYSNEYFYCEDIYGFIR